MRSLVSLFTALSVFELVSSTALSAIIPEPLAPASVIADSVRPGHPATQVLDGDTSDSSRWLSDNAAGPHWLQFDFDTPRTFAGLHVFSGYDSTNALTDFTVQFWHGGSWVDVPSASVTGNQSPALALQFDDTVTVTSTKLRLWITKTPENIARIAEVALWPASVGSVPPIPHSREADAVSRAPVGVFLNQSGFNSGAPKRFTAPGRANASFQIFPVGGGAPVFTGKLQGEIGDFTAFEPSDTRGYVVAVGDLLSVPFRVGPWWLERVTTQRSVDFMIDSRHYVGNDRRKCVGSYGWRDDHHFGWELHTLVPQWLSNPSAYSRLPRQITYEPPADPKLWGKLQPPSADAPDLVKLIHWGADVIVTQNTTHELMKSQLAYFLYAWPVLQDHLPAQNYEVVRDFTFKTWAAPVADHKYPYDESPEHDLLALKTKIGNTKGAYPPGFSVQPNLLLHEVARREGRPDAGRYLDAAVRQAAWLVAHLDWNDPLTTKGQRMSEFITVTGLAHLLAEYPSHAPAGLAQKLNDWAAVVIRRSANLWDFRKLGDAPDQWTPMGEKPTMWNEPGNVVGLPSAIFAALPFITDADASTRLHQIAWSHFDALFGRNPTGRHFSYDAPRELEGVEHGWYNFHVGGIGRLEKARFVLDGSPKNQHFPFQPEVGNVGWTEGWIQHNTPFNLSLAYLARSQSSLTLSREGDSLLIRLRAPLDFDYTKRESGTVTVTTSAGPGRPITVTEDSASSRYFSARVPLPAGPVRASYGFGYLATTAQLDP